MKVNFKYDRNKLYTVRMASSLNLLKLTNLRNNGNDSNNNAEIFYLGLIYIIKD